MIKISSTTLDEEIILDKNIKHDIMVVLDRIVLKEGVNSRLTDSIETALKLGSGIAIVKCNDERELFSTNYACPYCGWTLEEVTPRLFGSDSKIIFIQCAVWCLPKMSGTWSIFRCFKRFDIERQSSFNKAGGFQRDRLEN